MERCSLCSLRRLRDELLRSVLRSHDDIDTPWCLITVLCVYCKHIYPGMWMFSILWLSAMAFLFIH